MKKHLPNRTFQKLTQVKLYLKNRANGSQETIPLTLRIDTIEINYEKGGILNYVDDNENIEKDKIV